LPKGWSANTYEPFGNIEGYELIRDTNGTVRYLICLKFGYILSIRPGGYIPRSGLALCQHLIDVVDEEVFDIGTGDSGILGIHCYTLGAKSVIACDIDPKVIAWAKRHGPSKISWIVGDTYTMLKNSQRFDLIVSNPPQLPMEHPGIFHDYGGWDGRSCIKKIINGAPHYLKTRGKLLLLVFDFLSTLERYGPEQSITEMITSQGLRYKVVGEYTKQIRSEGETRKSLDWIQKIYPWYQFSEESNGILKHKVLILEIKK